MRKGEPSSPIGAPPASLEGTNDTILPDVSYYGRDMSPQMDPQLTAYHACPTCHGCLRDIITTFALVLGSSCSPWPPSSLP